MVVLLDGCFLVVFLGFAVFVFFTTCDLLVLLLGFFVFVFAVFVFAVFVLFVVFAFVVFAEADFLVVVGLPIPNKSGID